jgi:hypothetical protein
MQSEGWGGGMRTPNTSKKEGNHPVCNYNQSNEAIEWQILRSILEVSSANLGPDTGYPK